MEENRTYELGYLLVPTITEDKVADSIAALAKIITDAAGTVHTQSEAEHIDLTYTITVDHVGKKEKWDTAYFGSMKFTAEPEQIAAIQKALDADMHIVRYLLTKTSLENVIAFKKPTGARREKVAVEEDAVLAEILAADAAGVVAEEEEESTEEVPLAAHEKLPELEITE